MNISPLYEEMKFHFLRDFATWAEDHVANDWATLESNSEKGVYEEYEDYESAMDYPLFRTKYVAESILHLLNALVEEQLRILVEETGKISIDKEVPKLPSEEIAKLHFPDLISRIESEYNVTLKEIEYWADYLKIRKIVNALKHNSGRRYLKDILVRNCNFKDLKYEITLEMVKNNVEICLKLIRNLYSITVCR